MPHSADHPRQQPASSPPLVSTVGDCRSMEFMSGNVQSAMRLSRPDQLVLAYTRAMMCFALFVPAPRHIVMVGLGGGSLAKFCYRHFPATQITVIELRADVIALREQFRVPPDDGRFKVVHADAAEWMAGAADCADVIVLDGFDEAGLPAALGSSRFYADCRKCLRMGGVLAANIFSYDAQYGAMAGRLRLIFDDRLCHFEGVAGNNRVLFAVKAPFHAEAASAGLPALRTQERIARRQGLGSAMLNRWLVRLLVAWLARRE